MKKQLILSVLVSFCLLTGAQNQVDTTVVNLNEVVINSLKETSPKQTPVSSTILNSKLINSTQITNIKGQYWSRRERRYFFGYNRTTGHRGVYPIGLL